jgi:hypothetical protein
MIARHGPLRSWLGAPPGKSVVEADELSPRKLYACEAALTII